MIDYKYKIRILGILDYYKLNMKPINNWRSEFKDYSFQRNIFIECHGKFSKIKINKTGDLQDTVNVTCKEKEINDMYFVPKDGFEQYTLMGDNLKKELINSTIYDADKMGVFTKFVDEYLDDINADDFKILYNEDICLIYLDGKLVDVAINDEQFKECPLEQMFEINKEQDMER